MTGFPDIVRGLPQAEHPFRGISISLLRGPTACAIFVEATDDAEVPEHAHGAQWGVVVAGDLVLRIGEETRTYRPGEEYLIPAGVPHAARLTKGVRVIDFLRRSQPVPTAEGVIPEINQSRPVPRPDR